MSDQTLVRNKDDERIEWQFIVDYAEFALRMNLRAIVALLEKARSLGEKISRKSICLSGLQLLYSSYEDFAVLLVAFRKKMGGQHLHLTIGVEDQGRVGTTLVPRLFKRYDSARQMLDDFGFTSITHEKLSQYLNISEEELEEHYRDVADSIKGLGEYQNTFNDYKNKLKHGKPVLEGEANTERPDDVLFIEWSKQGGNPVLELHWVTASLEQLEVATKQVAKIYIRSLEFLWLFMLHYYPDRADSFLYEVMAPCSRDCIEQVHTLRLVSEGLTDFR